MKKLLLTMTLLIASSTMANAQMLFKTSFENEQAFPGKYTDTGDAAKNHQLANNPDEPIVNSTSNSESNGDLGFSASYVNTRNSMGLTNGVYFGVIKTKSTVGEFSDGEQGYILSDCDGKAQLIFNNMDLSNSVAVKISVDIFIKDTSYEGNDSLLVAVKSSKSPINAAVLLGLSGDEIENNPKNGTWQTITATITDTSELKAAQLYIEFDSNSADERVYIDNIRVESIPEPATVSTIAVGSALCWLRQQQ